MVGEGWQVKVTAVHVETLELGLEEPFVIASSALAVSPCDLVRVETDEGLIGLGEACPATSSPATRSGPCRT